MRHPAIRSALRCSLPKRPPSPGLVNTTVNVPSFALSPDGRALVFSAQATGAKPTLWVRAMDSVGARQLAGTDDAQDPMWSPDSHWIAFFADGKLKKVPAAGGPVQVITQAATDFRGGTWGPDGTILFSSGTDAIASVNTEGSKVTPSDGIRSGTSGDGSSKPALSARRPAFSVLHHGSSRRQEWRLRGLAGRPDEEASSPHQHQRSLCTTRVPVVC